MLKFKLMGHWQLRQLPKGSEPCLNQWRHQLAGVQRHQHRWHSPTDPAIRMHNFNTSTCPNQVATCKSKHHVQASHQIIQTSQKKNGFGSGHVWMVFNLEVKNNNSSNNWTQSITKLISRILHNFHHEHLVAHGVQWQWAKAATKDRFTTVISLIWYYTTSYIFRRFPR